MESATGKVWNPQAKRMLTQIYFSFSICLLKRFNNWSAGMLDPVEGGKVRDDRSTGLRNISGYMTGDCPGYGGYLLPF
jgi:hypothetical protein